MIRFILTLVLMFSLHLTCFSQEQLPAMNDLSTLVSEFEASIETKDSSRFKKLFFDDQVKFVGIMSSATEMSIKKDFPEFEGVAVSTCSQFIADICTSEKPQKEHFYKINIETDKSIGSVSFDYSFISGTKMIQWGHEHWNVVKIGGEWLITDVIYSIHVPDVEEFPHDEGK